MTTERLERVHMPTATHFLDKKTIAELTARMYLDTGAGALHGRQAIHLHERLGEPGL